METQNRNPRPSKKWALSLSSANWKSSYHWALDFSELVVAGQSAWAVAADQPPPLFDELRIEQRMDRYRYYSNLASPYTQQAMNNSSPPSSLGHYFVSPFLHPMHQHPLGTSGHSTTTTINQSINNYTHQSVHYSICHCHRHRKSPGQPLSRINSVNCSQVRHCPVSYRLLT